MIDRIVQMTFRLEEVEAFRALFEQHKQSIRNQPGCQLLRLVQDVHDPCVFFTYSRWASEDHLNAYRRSETFGVVWPETKSKFAAKPQAWSTQVQAELP